MMALISGNGIIGSGIHIFGKVLCPFIVKKRFYPTFAIIPFTEYPQDFPPYKTCTPG